MNLNIFCVFLILQLTGKFDCLISLNEPSYSWRQIDYHILDSQRSNKQSEGYIRYNNLPMGATRWRNKLFITVPRRNPGIPATLNYIRLLENDILNRIDQPLIPYPNLSFNRLQFRRRNQMSNLVSVYRTTTDECNRLWMVDTGLLEYPGNSQRIQRPAIIVFDLLTDQLLHRYELPETVVGNFTSPTLASISVDVVQPDRCNETFAYIPDLEGYGLIVFDMRQQHSWRFNHNYFHQDPIGGDFHINNKLHFQWNDGIFSISLSRKTPDGFRVAFFHALASTHDFSVSTRVLRNETNSQRSYHGNDFVHLGDKGRDQQTCMSTMDRELGVLFYTQVHLNGLACRNIYKPMNRENFVMLLQDNERFIYPSDVTHDDDGNIWILTNSMPYFTYSTLNPQSINYRIWKLPVVELIKNTTCIPPTWWDM